MVNEIEYIRKEVLFLCKDNMGTFTNVPYVDRMIEDITGISKFATKLIAAENQAAIVINAVRGPRGDQFVKMFNNSLHEARIDMIQVLAEAKKLSFARSKEGREDYNYISRMYRKGIKNLKVTIRGNEKAENYHGSFSSLRSLANMTPNGNVSTYFIDDDDDDEDEGIFGNDIPEFYPMNSISLSGNTELLRIIRKVEDRIGRSLSDSELAQLVERYKEDEAEDEDEDDVDLSDLLGKKSNKIPYDALDQITQAVTSAIMDKLGLTEEDEKKEKRGPHPPVFTDLDEMREYYEKHPFNDAAQAELDAEAALKKAEEPDDEEEDETPLTGDQPMTMPEIPSTKDKKVIPIDPLKITENSPTEDIIKAINNVQEPVKEKEPPKEERPFPEASEDSSDSEATVDDVTSEEEIPWNETSVKLIAYLRSIEGTNDKNIITKIQELNPLGLPPTYIKYVLTPSGSFDYLFTLYVFVNVRGNMSEDVITRTSIFHEEVSNIARILGIDSDQIRVNVQQYFFDNEKTSPTYLIQENLPEISEEKLNDYMDQMIDLEINMYEMIGFHLNMNNTLQEKYNGDHHLKKNIIRTQSTQNEVDVIINPDLDGTTTQSIISDINQFFDKTGLFDEMDVGVKICSESDHDGMESMRRNTIADINSALSDEDFYLNALIRATYSMFQDMIKLNVDPVLEMNGEMNTEVTTEFIGDPKATSIIQTILGEKSFGVEIIIRTMIDIRNKKNGQNISLGANMSDVEESMDIDVDAIKKILMRNIVNLFSIPYVGFYYEIEEASPEEIEESDTEETTEEPETDLFGLGNINPSK